MLEWRTIKKDKPFDNYEWYNAELKSEVDCTEYGETWGGKTAFIRMSFSIFPRPGKDCHSECLPFQLLINGGQSHVYLRNIEEGKQIAEEIACRLVEGLNCTKGDACPMQT